MVLIREAYPGVKEMHSLRSPCPMMYAYFDESERMGGVFCVAGFLFDAAQARRFTKEWSQLFSEYAGGLHMRHFLHGRGAFAGTTVDQRDRLLFESVKIINKTITAAFAVSCNLHEVELLAPKWIRGFSRAYPVCCHLVMIAAGQFLEESGRGFERITYIFESGHKDQSEADDHIRNAVLNPDVKNAYKYLGHDFLAKSDAVPLQAADLLAWEWTKFRDETLEQRIRPLRGSLRALFESNPKRYKGAHIKGEPLARFMVQIRQLGLLQIEEERQSKRRWDVPDRH